MKSSEAHKDRPDPLDLQDHQGLSDHQVSQALQDHKAYPVLAVLWVPPGLAVSQVQSAHQALQVPQVHREIKVPQVHRVLSVPQVHQDPRVYKAPSEPQAHQEHQVQSVHQEPQVLPELVRPGQRVQRVSDQRVQPARLARLVPKERRSTLRGPLPLPLIFRQRAIIRTMLISSPQMAISISGMVRLGLMQGQSLDLSVQLDPRVRPAQRVQQVLQARPDPPALERPALQAPQV